ncbi:MAG: glutaredoxin [Polyangiaceae bacterium]
MIVYSRPGCMFCSQVEGLLRNAGIRFEAIEITSREEQDGLISRFDTRSFPVVLVDGEFLGGFTHIVKLHAEGRLRTAVHGEADASDLSPLSEKLVSSKAPTDSRRGTLAELAKLGDYLKRQKAGD